MTALRLAKSDRKFALVLESILVFVVGAAVFLVKADDGEGRVPSSYSSGTNGAKAAFLLLEETGYRIQRLREGPRSLAAIANTTTLILVDPEPANEDDIKAVQAFIKNGGHVVGVGPGFAIFVKGDHITHHAPHFDWKTYAPRELSDLSRGIQNIQLPSLISFREDSGEDAPFKGDDENPVIRFSEGKGQVVWWSTSNLLSNRGISKADNFQLLLNSVGDPAGRDVLWDEYFHQGSKTLFDTFMNTPLRWGLLQCSLIALAACFTWSRRFGPLRSVPPASRLAPMEFVATLAQLYKKAGAGSVALEVVYRRFRANAHQRYLMGRDEGIEEVAKMIAQKISNLNEAIVARQLHAIEEGIGNSALSENRAWELIKYLHQLSNELGLNKGDVSWKL